MAENFQSEILDSDRNNLTKQMVDHYSQIAEEFDLKNLANYGIKKRNQKEKHVSLKNEINHHNFLYHNKDQPEITDNEYDQLFQELLKLENDYVFLDKSDSPTSRVGDTPQSDLKEFLHEAPMLSLDNAFELRKICTISKKELLIK